jgi:hypothetical protein
MSSRPTIKELAAWYNISHYLCIQMLIDAGVIEKKGKKGNRSRLYPNDVQLVINKCGSPLAK